MIIGDQTNQYNQLIAIGNNANSIIESQLLQLIGSSIIDFPCLCTKCRLYELSRCPFVRKSFRIPDNQSWYQDSNIQTEKSSVLNEF